MEEDWNQIKNSYAVHLWNHESKNEEIVGDGTQLIDLLAKNNCPVTYKALAAKVPDK